MENNEPTTVASATGPVEILSSYNARTVLPPTVALAECLALWEEGIWRDRDAVVNLNEVMSHIERLLDAPE